MKGEWTRWVVEADVMGKETRDIQPVVKKEVNCQLPVE
jgi:hypothetical protein